MNWDSMNFKALNDFLVLSESKSFAAAASKLNVTPAALSQSIKAFEDQLGIRLFNRTTRSVSHTELGRELWESCKNPVGEVRAAFERFSERKATVSGRLRITMPSTFGRHYIEPLLPKFFHQYPEVKLELVYNDELVDIVEQGLDAGIRIGEYLKKDMIAIPITGDMKMMIVGAPKYFKTFPKPKTLTDLRKHRCITYRFGGGEVYRWELQDGKRIFEADLDGQVICNSGETMIDLARSGVGLALITEDLIREDLKAGRLVQVLESTAITFPGYHLYYPSRTHLPPKLAAFKSLLAAHYRIARSQNNT